MTRQYLKRSNTSKCAESCFIQKLKVWALKLYLKTSDNFLQFEGNLTRGREVTSVQGHTHTRTAQSHKPHPASCQWLINQPEMAANTCVLIFPFRALSSTSAIFNRICSTDLFKARSNTVRITLIFPFSHYGDLSFVFNVSSHLVICQHSWIIQSLIDLRHATEFIHVPCATICVEVE